MMEILIFLSVMRLCRWIVWLVITTIVMCLWLFSHAQNLDVMNLPAMAAPVVDYTNTLTTEQLAQLNMRAIWWESWYQWAQVTAVIIPDRQGYELFDIAMKIASSNQIGQDRLDNWLLLVIAKDEKKLRIVVWYGLEWVIPDILASQIIEQDLRPLVDQWDIYWAVQKRYEVIPQYLISWSIPNTLQQSHWLDTLGGLAIFLAFALVWWWGYLWSKLGDYLNGKETHTQLTELKTKSGFIKYSWILWLVMFMLWIALWFMTFVLLSWLAWFVLGAVGSYTRVISPNFWQTIRQEMNRNRWWWWGFGGWGWFGGGWRSGGWGSFGGWGAGD